MIRHNIPYQLNLFDISVSKEDILQLLSDSIAALEPHIKTVQRLQAIGSPGLRDELNRLTDMAARLRFIHIRLSERPGEIVSITLATKEFMDEVYQELFQTRR